MNTITISATAARNNFFEILNKVAQGTVVVVKKDNKEIAVINQRQSSTDWNQLRKATSRSKGILAGSGPSALRTAQSHSFLGKWDSEA